MKRLWGLLCAGLLLLGVPPLAIAQETVKAVTVSACGTPNNTPVVGNPYPITQDTAGRQCGAISGSVNAGGFSFQVSPTITVQNASYAAGNSEGGLITVTGAARTAGGSGTLAQFRLRSVGGSTNTVWVYAWSKTPASTCTDKAAFVSSAGDGLYSLPGFPLQLTLGGAPGAWDTYTYAQALGQNSVFKNQDTAPATAVYMCIVTAGTVTPASTSDLSIVIAGYQD